MFKASLKNNNIPELGTVTVEFPIPEAQYEETIRALNGIQSGAVVEQDCFVADIGTADCPALERLIGTMANVDELDWLGKQLESFDRYELLQFNAAVERFGLSAADELIDLSFCTREVTVISDFTDLEKTGKRHYAPITPGTEGVVDLVDDAGSIHMKWDNDRTLAIVPGEDSFTVLPPKLETLKLYMPLTADFYEPNEYGDLDENGVTLEGEELREYESQIAAALNKYRMPEEAERGVMHWYGRAFSMEEKFDRVKSIPLLDAVDIVMSPAFINEENRIRENVARTGLKVASIAVDTIADPVFQKGSFAAVDPQIRDLAIQRAKQAIDFARTVNCNVVTTWPGQDGYDYIFQADYIKERTLFQDAMIELCDYAPDMTITMEYKIKEPRTHCYISTVGTALLMCEAAGKDNLGIALDYGHATLGYETPAEAVAICKMYGDRLKHIHINDNYRLWDDDLIVGSVHTLEFIEFIYWLRRTGYTGYMTLDQFPYREDGREAVAESAQWLDFLESIADNADMDEIHATIAKNDAISASRLMRKLLKG